MNAELGFENDQPTCLVGPRLLIPGHERDFLKAIHAIYSFNAREKGSSSSRGFRMFGGDLRIQIEGNFFKVVAYVSVSEEVEVMQSITEKNYSKRLSDVETNVSK